MWDEVLLFLVPFRSELNFGHVNLAYLQKSSLNSGERSVPLGALVLLRWKGGGGALVHVYVREHRVSLNYRITWWIFTKFGRDKVLMTPAHLYWILDQSAQGWIQGRAIIGLWGPSSKGHLQSWKATATNRMHSNDLKAFEKKCGFWHVLVVVY